MPMDELVLAVGCTLRVQTPSPIGAVVQVAPAPAPELTVRCEQWDTTARHHTYVDRYGNRCERFLIEAGETGLTYDAVVECSPEPTPSRWTRSKYRRSSYPMTCCTS